MTIACAAAAHEHVARESTNVWQAARMGLPPGPQGPVNTSLMMACAGGTHCGVETMKSRSRAIVDDVGLTYMSQVAGTSGDGIVRMVLEFSVLLPGHEALSLFCESSR